MMLLAVIYEIIFQQVSYQSLIKKILVNVSLVQSWIPFSDYYFSLNGVAWYLSTSFVLYIAYPFIRELLKVKKNYLINIFLLYFGMIIIAYLFAKTNLPKEQMEWFTYIFPLFRIGDFAIGCNLGLLFLKNKKLGSKICTIMEICSFTLAIISLYVYEITSNNYECSWYRYTLLFIPSVCCLIYILAVNKGFMSKLLSNKNIVKIGNLSGYAFIVHQMILWYIRAFLDYFEVKYNAILLVLFVLLGTIFFVLLIMRIKNIHTYWVY